MNTLQMTCDKCKIAGTCPKKGASPLVVGKQRVQCQILGGYARKPVSPTILGARLKARQKKDGPCMTMVKVPTLDEQGDIIFEDVKVFSQPILHDREKSKNVPALAQNLLPQAHTFTKS